MLDTEWSTGNIFKRLRSKTKESVINIFCNDSKNIFDQLIQNALPDVCFSNSSIGQSVFNFDFTSFNSVFVAAKELNTIHNTYTGIILFNHSDISNIKKEDKIILNSNLSNVKVINFDLKSNEVFNNSLDINYPFPDFTKTPIDRVKDLLIVNGDNNAIAQNLFQSISSTTNISVDINENLTADLNTIKNQMSQYKVVLDLSNRLTHILALLSGCSVVTHKSIDGYLESPYITKFDTFNTAIDAIEYNLQNNNSNDIESLKQIYSSKNFSETFKEYIYGNN